LLEVIADLRGAGLQIYLLRQGRQDSDPQPDQSQTAKRHFA